MASKDKFQSSKKGKRHAKTISSKGESRVTKAGRKSDPHPPVKKYIDRAIAEQMKPKPASAYEIDRFTWHEDPMPEKTISRKDNAELYAHFMKGD